MTGPTPADLASADAVARMLAWLRVDPAVLAAFGDANHVSGQNRAPYPHMRVSPSPGGSDGDLRWLLEQEVALTAFGDLDGTLGSSALKALLYVALSSAYVLGETPPTGGESVVCGVRSSSAARPLDIPLTGQPAWTATVIVTIHPPVP
jgi:hypothetical protein